MDGKVEWPSRDRVLEAFDATSALRDLLSGVDFRSVALWIGSKQFPSDARRELGRLIGMKDFSRPTGTLVEKIVEAIALNDNLEGLRPLVHGWTQAFNCEGDDARWSAMLRGDDHGLVARSRKGTVPVEGLIQYLHDSQPTLTRAGLLAAIAFSNNPLPALVLLAADYEPARDALLELASSFAEVPLTADWSITGPAESGQPEDHEAEPSLKVDIEDESSRHSNSAPYASAQPLAAATHGSAELRLQAAEDLLVEAVELALSLRESAELIETGIPQQALADSLIGWTTRASELVGTDGNLTEFAAEQRSDIAQADAEAHHAQVEAVELEALMRKVRGLEALGTAEFISTLLASKGYDSRHEVEARLAVLRGVELRQPDPTVNQVPPEVEAMGVDTGLLAPDDDEPAARASAALAAVLVERSEPSPVEVDESVAPTGRGPARGSQPDGVGAGPRFDEAETSTGDETQAAAQEEATGQGDLDSSPSAALIDVEHLTVDGQDDSHQLEHEPDESRQDLVTKLIAEGRELLAVHVLRQEGGERQVRLAKVLAASFNCRSDILEVDLMNLLLSSDDVAALEPDEVRVYLSAGIRASLSLGYSPIALQPLLDRALLEDHPAWQVVSKLEPLATRGFRRPRTASSIALVGSDDWRDLATHAAQLRESLTHITINYRRAGAIVRHLGKNNQELGGALVALERLATARAAGEPGSVGDVDRVRQTASVLQDYSKRERLVEHADAAVSSPSQTRAIEANALDRLNRAIDSVSDLLQRGLGLQASADRASIEPNNQDASIFEELRSRIPVFDAATPGAASLKRLLTWIVDAGDPTGENGLDRQLENALLPLSQLPRDGAQRPTREPSLQELAALVDSPTWEEVFRGYLGSGNLAQAASLLDSPTLDGRDDLFDELQRSKRDWRRRFDDTMTAARRVTSRLRSLDDDEETRRLAIQLEDGTSPIEGRYDLSLADVDASMAHGRRRLESIRTDLRKRVEALSDTDDRLRITALIDGEDEPLAVEWLSLAETGESLPEAGTVGVDDLRSFFPGLVQAAGATRDAKSVIAAIHEHMSFTGEPNDQMRRGIAGWTGLSTDRQQGDVRRRIADVLRMLGLIPAADGALREVTKTKLAGYASWEIKASPVDGSYVPNLGSQANRTYDVTLVWVTASPERLLQFVDEDRRHRAQLILYFGTLSPQQRIDLRRQTTSGFSPIVIDHAVIGWLTTRREPGWKLTQRVTLPFTSINPYTPFAAGEVPEEMFVGRAQERREIIDPNGSMFVYGGRQLGKSALLRRVERGLRNSGETAIYFDLKSAGVGDASPASMLWVKLEPRLSDAGVLQAPKGQKEWSADSVIAGIEAWLHADGSRRLLLLLDEADNFLTADAQEAGSFPTLQRLKGLMERSGRRFKVVFAGLHQVQRFHSLPNTPVVHGGRDILIGPLTTSDARELVVGPLTALGYQFESPETVWRLLLLTNYQASLIQIICNALINHVRTERMPAGGRIVITNRHVDEIYQKRDVRELIEDRFRWTINLDSRYRVIALVTALLSKGASSGTTFQPAELHDQCEDFWPDGFARRNLGGRQFERYLDELVGLGILRESNGEFGLRSPNILNLLGSQDSIESELLEASSVMRLEMAYNPSVHRRVLSVEPTGDGQMSPLPDSDLAALVDHKTDTRVRAVLGTRALGISRVATAIELVANENGLRCIRVGSDELERMPIIKSDEHLVVDLFQNLPTQGALKNLLGSIAQLKSFATLVVDVSQIDLGSSLAEIPVVPLKRWSTEGLQTLQDSPFSTPADISALEQATGGWLELVEQVLNTVSAGASAQDAMSSVTRDLCSQERARQFLKSAGAPIESLIEWTRWFTSVDSEGHLVVEPVDSTDLEESEVAKDGQELIRELINLDLVDEGANGWLLDPVVAQLAKSLDHDG